MIIDIPKIYTLLLDNILLEVTEENKITKEILQSDEQYTDSFRNYLIWRYLERYLPNISKIERYINMYYWFSRFYMIYKDQIGIDAGIEQQMGNLLEEIANNTTDFDWDILSNMDSNLKNELNIA